MNNEEAKQLIIKYNNGQCTQAEKRMLENWYSQLNEHDIDLSPERIEQLGEEVRQNLHKLKAHHPNRKLRPFLAVAATILLISFAAVFYFKTPIIATPSIAAEITPGSNKATLTLANGKTINLSDAKTGIVIGASSLKYNDGTALLSPSGRDGHRPERVTERVESNSNSPLSPQGGSLPEGERKGRAGGKFTVTTPKGGQYQIELPDGTKVWLNAASTLTFGYSLKGRGGEKRMVELNGEAYFEVFKDKTRPFIVKTRLQQVEVLGTHFNINAYTDEAAVKTTLLEGSVKVSFLSPSGRDPFRERGLSTSLSGLRPSLPVGERKRESERVLLPNQQSVIIANSPIKVENVNTDLTVAWKNGKTEFRDANIKSIMKMLERWYNIEVIYNGAPTDSYYSGSVARTRNISEVLQLLESTGEVHFKIEGRRVEVLK